MDNNFEIKKLTSLHTQAFCDLIIDMYKHLENLEWFSPMPYDYNNVKSILENPRFFVVGVFDGDILCAVSSFDYKCGKLIGKIQFPKECNTDKLVEIGFTMVNSNYRGKKLMKTMVKYLVEEAKKQNFEWVFAKVHAFNIASEKSMLNNDFKKVLQFDKTIKVADIKDLIKSGNVNKTACKKMNDTLQKYNNTNEEITVKYNIILKKI